MRRPSRDESPGAELLRSERDRRRASR
jgi:hypothetical protein